MTKLEQIKAECRKAIELGEAATAGPWEHSGNSVVLSPFHKREYWEWMQNRMNCETTLDDGAFIAHARTFSPAAAKALLVAIEALELAVYGRSKKRKRPDHLCDNDGQGCGACEEAEAALEQICQNWPDPVQEQP